MNVETHAEVRGWLRKAEGDLGAAIVLKDADPKRLDISVYHCQQAAEKAIKAWLVSREISFSKTHDLERLLECANSDSGLLSHLGEHMLILTPYVVEFRYPGDVFEPEESEVIEAIRLATEVLACITNLLPVNAGIASNCLEH